MEPSFWKQRWENNEIAFHQDDVHPLLAKNFDQLHLEQNSRIFVPLCGKTVDIAWFMANGFRIVGVELVQTAIEQLFEELDVKPEIETIGGLLKYKANGIEIFVGDIFELDIGLLGDVDAIYDRAALNALPENIRNKYAKHLIDISECAQQLLICIEYDQSLMQGPPFSISEEAVKEYYLDTYKTDLIDTVKLAGRFEDVCAIENVWLLTRT